MGLDAARGFEQGRTDRPRAAVDRSPVPLRHGRLAESRQGCGGHSPAVPRHGGPVGATGTRGGLPRSVRGTGKTGTLMARLDWQRVILSHAREIVESYDTGVTLRQLFYRLVSDGTLPN